MHLRISIGNAILVQLAAVPSGSGSSPYQHALTNRGPFPCSDRDSGALGEDMPVHPEIMGPQLGQRNTFRGSFCGCICEYFDMYCVGICSQLFSLLMSGIKCSSPPAVCRDRGSDLTTPLFPILTHTGVLSTYIQPQPFAERSTADGRRDARREL